MDAYQAMALLESKLVNSPKKKMIVYENADHDLTGFSNNIVREVIEFINQ